MATSITINPIAVVFFLCMSFILVEFEWSPLLKYQSQEPSRALLSVQTLEAKTSMRKCYPLIGRQIDDAMKRVPSYGIAYEMKSKKLEGETALHILFSGSDTNTAINPASVSFWYVIAARMTAYTDLDLWSWALVCIP
jgi:hypothetical protein